MDQRVLNLTNGDYFNEYFLKSFGGEAIPFREAMMDGLTEREIFSQAFIAARCEALEVLREDYLAKAQVFDALRDGGKEYDQVHLWFGKDCFCQMNLLTLLAYLEQICYGNRVILNLIDDESFSVLREGIEISLGAYQKLYEEILILKKMPSETHCLEKEAVRLYFDYHSPDGKLSKLVEEHSEMDETSLICLLLRESAEYGLSDQQAKKLIRRVWRSKKKHHLR